MQAGALPSHLDADLQMGPIRMVPLPEKIGIFAVRTIFPRPEQRGLSGIGSISARVWFNKRPAIGLNPEVHAREVPAPLDPLESPHSGAKVVPC